MNAKLRPLRTWRDGLVPSIFVAVTIFGTVGAVLTFDWTKRVTSEQKNATHVAQLLKKLPAVCDMPFLKKKVVKINERIEEGQEAEQRLKWLYVPAYGAESWSKFKQLELPDCLKRADKVPRGPHT